jgi:formamidopyrimidine-DNA glycosylase
VPELPEVETIVRGLADTLPGRKIGTVEVLRPDLIAHEPAADFARELPGRRIERVSRRAKNIAILLDDGSRLMVNLGMTGNLMACRAGEMSPSHLGVRIALDGGWEMLYNDSRRFGRLWRLDEAGWKAFDRKLGIEPLSRRFTGKALHEMALRSRVAVKTWLMDQARVVGVGNIYASEALFRARIDPRRPADALTEAEAGRIARGVREVLNEAIEFRGTTLLDYRDAEGNTGEFAKRLRVYDREGEPCIRCHRPIKRIVQANRSTFYCPRCQR